MTKPLAQLGNKNCLPINRYNFSNGINYYAVFQVTGYPLQVCVYSLYPLIKVTCPVHCNSLDFTTITALDDWINYECLHRVISDSAPYALRNFLTPYVVLSNSLTELSPSWEAVKCAATHSLYFMEPEGSLPCPQEPSTGPFLGQIDPVHIIPS
jgi:hypothetical protein